MRQFWLTSGQNFKLLVRWLPQPGRPETLSPELREPFQKEVVAALLNEITNSQPSVVPSLDVLGLHSHLPTWLHPFIMVHPPKGLGVAFPKFHTKVQSVDDDGNILLLPPSPTSPYFPKTNSLIRCVLHGLEPIGSVWWTQEAISCMRQQLIRPHAPGFQVTVTVHVQGDPLHVKLTYARNCMHKKLIKFNFATYHA